MKIQQASIPAPGRVEIHEAELREPGPAEIQARTLANGICMAEVSIFRGTEKPPPWGVGHEGVGVVTKLGREVKGIREGDCVVTTAWATAENIAAERAVLFARPPADPALFIVEPVACAVTAWYSYGIIPGDRVLLLGAGYMGLLNVQALGRSPLAELVVTDVRDDNLALAREFGATETINSATPAGKARLDALRETPFDLVIECAGVPATIALAGPLTRGGGRLAIFAWHHEPRHLDLGLWHCRGLKVLNCAPGIGTDWAIQPFQRAVRLLECGRVDQRQLITHRHPFAEVQQALALAAARPPGYRKGVLLFA